MKMFSKSLLLVLTCLFTLQTHPNSEVAKLSDSEYAAVVSLFNKAFDCCESGNHLVEISSLARKLVGDFSVAELKVLRNGMALYVELQWLLAKSCELREKMDTNCYDDSSRSLYENSQDAKELEKVDAKMEALQGQLEAYALREEDKEKRRKSYNLGAVGQIKMGEKACEIVVESCDEALKKRLSK